MPRSETYDGTEGFCEHCWTVSDLLQRWEIWDTAGCLCRCHKPKDADIEPKKRRKKKQ